MSRVAWAARLEARLDRLGRALLTWWTWPAALVALAAAVLLASWSFVPGEEGRVAFLGLLAFPTCPTLAATGLPCGQCGMTRSFVWAARGHVALAFAYSPAGLALWGWLVGGGLLGAARLLRRAPRLGRIPPLALGVGAGAWIALYALAHHLRLAGVHPLP